VLVHTSGTTGSPKLVEHDGGVIAAAARRVARLVMLGRSHRLLVPRPLFHTYGALIVVPAALSVGATIVLEHPAKSALPLLAAIARHQVTHMVGVSAVFADLVEQASAARAFDLASLEVCLSADDPLLPVIQERFEEQYQRPLVQGYGLTEALAVAMIPGFDFRHPGSVGQPLEGMTVEIQDALGAPRPSGAMGEIVVRGPSVMLGYATADDEQPSRDTPQEREARTGDLGWLDQLGYLYVEGRKNLGDGATDVGEWRGIPVSCRAVEDRLIRAGAARRAKALLTREGLELFLVPPSKAGPPPVAQALGDLGLPVQVQFLPELPMTAVGKVASARLACRQATGARDGR
jgi:long-chain acyl-CoA synthetase